MTSVQQTIVVDVPPQRAFAVFTEGIDSWWPPDHVLGEAPARRSVLEGHEGGRAYSIDATGAECAWGRVLAYEPPHRLLLSWDITVAWRPESDPAKASEVEVTFTAEGAGTRVVLEHRHLDRHGEGWEAMRDAVGSEDGWAMHLRRFAAALSPAVRAPAPRS